MVYVDNLFAKLERFYERILASTLNHLSVVVVFAIIILASNYFLFITSASELAPQEDLGVIIAQVTAPANSSLAQTKMYADEVGKIFKNTQKQIIFFKLMALRD